MRVLHVTPDVALRNGISEYATTFGRAMNERGGLTLERLFFPENTFSQRELARHLAHIDVAGFDLIHGEIGVGTNSVFYVLNHLAQDPRARFLVTLHDPPLVLFSPTVDRFGYHTAGYANKALRKLVTDPLFDRLILPRRMARLRNLIVLNRGATTPTEGRFPGCTVRYSPLIASSSGSAKRRTGEPSDVLFYGYLARAKGVELALAAIAHLRSRAIDLRLHIVGGCLDESYQRSLIEAVRDQSLVDHVVWHGFVADHDLGALFDRCGLVMMPYHETQSLGASAAIVRAMEHGLPVVLSDIRRFADEYADGEDVLMFRSGDALDLAEKVRALVTDDALRQTMSERSLRRIQAVHAPAGVVSTFLEHYHAAVSDT